eukprot:14297778-Alexandrium_andersonii.AAC.1
MPPLAEPLRLRMPDRSAGEFTKAPDELLKELPIREIFEPHSAPLGEGAEAFRTVAEVGKQDDPRDPILPFPPAQGVR